MFLQDKYGNNPLLVPIGANKWLPLNPMFCWKTFTPCWIENLAGVLKRERWEAEVVGVIDESGDQTPGAELRRLGMEYESCAE